MSRLKGVLSSALAGLTAGTLLLTSGGARAAAQNAKKVEAPATPPSASAPKKVSPYATLNRQRWEAAEKERERSKKGAPNASRLHPVSVRKH